MNNDNVVRDMDGNELKIGDVILFATHNKTIARAKIISLVGNGWLGLSTLKSRKSTAISSSVLLDKSY